MKIIDRLIIHKETDHFGINSFYVLYNGKQYYFSHGCKRIAHFSNYINYIEGYIYPSIWEFHWKKGKRLFVKRFYKSR